MAGLTIVGLGLHDELDLSLRGLEAAKRAEELYLEQYSSLMAGLSIARLEGLVEREIRLLDRENLEGPGLARFLQEASVKDIVLLVPGDPLTATTHQTIRLEALEKGLQFKVIHGASIFTAAPALSGLFIYKFGASATITFPDNPSSVAYDCLKQNAERGLHTLFFLDLRASEKRYLTIPEALRILTDSEKRYNEAVVTDKSLFVGVARAGSENPRITAGTVQSLSTADFGAPPHILIATGHLHFMEEQALRLLSSTNIRGHAQ